MKFIPLYLLLGSLFSSYLSAQQKTLELYITDYSPYMIIEGENFSGIDVEVTQAAFAEVGVETKFLAAPWKRILKSLEHGRIAGALTCSKRADRFAFIDYSDEISQANQVAITSTTTDDSKLIHLPDLNQFSVIVVEGWGVQKELTRENIKHATTQKLDSGIKSVVFRNIDVLYSGELTTLYRARKLGLQDRIKTKRFLDKQSTSLHLCLSKKFADNTVLLEKFNAGLKKIKASGKFAAIYQKYL